ncbi:NepR family anti-sigma factor [Jannaschia sp. LMIT008]|uniref:NepR family anti-sigma factor n=1 Tax=Jannaschia maritima TaxID=3032585 RepID=UPI0028117ABE|nr:NepR family anti-sigma factor [Jannaschia sp. LMIT008]
MDTDDENPKVDKLIDANLKRVYDSVLQEDIPDRFAQLLSQLEKGEVPPTVDDAPSNRTGEEA